jgi:hypothetical protein
VVICSDLEDRIYTLPNIAIYGEESGMRLSYVEDVTMEEVSRGVAGRILSYGGLELLLMSSKKLLRNARYRFLSCRKILYGWLRQHQHLALILVNVWIFELSLVHYPPHIIT